MTQGGEEQHSVWTFEADSQHGDILKEVDIENGTLNVLHTQLSTIID